MLEFLEGVLDSMISAWSFTAWFVLVILPMTILGGLLYLVA